MHSHTPNKIQNPASLLQALNEKLPRTELPIIPATFHRVSHTHPPSEDSLISHYLSDENVQVGGWKPKPFLSVEDIKHSKISNTPYLPIPLQKFEVAEKLLPDHIIDSIFNSQNFASGKLKAEDLEKSQNLTTNPNNHSVSEISGLSSILSRLNEDSGEPEELRLARLQARNKKVLSMADRLLSKPRN